MLILLLLALLGVIYLYAKYHYSYWNRRGVDQLDPQLLFGNFRDVAFQKCNFFMHFEKLHNAFKGRFGGIYLFTEPTIMIKDPQLIRQILIKDFDYFMDRKMYVNEEDEPITAHLFSLRGDRWRFMRNRLSPTFTSGKLKQMIPNIVSISDRLQAHVTKCVENGETKIEMRDMMARFTTDVITSVAFGVEIDSINNSNEKFREIGEKIISPPSSGLIFLKSMFAMVAPELAKFFKIRTANPDVEKFFTDILKQTINLRENENVVRHDFMQLMIQIRNSGQVNSSDDGNWKTTIVDESLKQMTTNEMVAQVFLFFLGGFDTTSSVISFAFFELAKNKAAQKRVQNEIDEVLARHNNKLSYEALQEMKYLDQIIDETLRMYPPGAGLFRSATKPYKIPDSDVIIEKGTPVFISVSGLHHDPKYFPNPYVFDPERFSSSAKVQIVPGTYLPFGDGPRNCIGMRLGQLQARIGIVSVISKFDMELAPDRSPIIEMQKITGFMIAEGGINLILSPRKK